MQTETFGPRRGRVIIDHEMNFPDPLSVHTGDIVALDGREEAWDGHPEWTYLFCVGHNGKSGWVPADLIARDGDKGTVRADYDTRVISVTAGETLIVERAAYGWLWCINDRGASGWVPARDVEVSDMA